MIRLNLNIVFLGLSITSSWGNGHATIYRALMKALDARGHRVLFLEHDKPWYAENRDLPTPTYGRTALYSSVEALKDEYAREVREADLVVVGSYVPEGVAVGQWVLEEARGGVAFYDIDTPVTLARLPDGEHGYIDSELVRRYPLYLSFTGGPILERLQREYGSPCARPLYCCVDPELYYPAAAMNEATPETGVWDLGYMGTYSGDRLAKLNRLLLDPARRMPGQRFIVVGPRYPDDYPWPGNVERVEHLPPGEHCGFYNCQRFTLNITRRDMVEAGYSPSVRLFEAAACGTPIISDDWPGLGTFFEPGHEVLIAESSQQVIEYLNGVSETDRRRLGERARARVLSEHTAAHRARQIEQYAMMLLDRARPRAAG
ncbi:glycosyltransferase [Phycisphaerales bacterium AB-hyl4]|uniref:Glycosyltransferase n=1 Tax=Natronomicrosphaera hydrolytica TaxID=3242702 RepID=A0ABV4U828_9BACT